MEKVENYEFSTFCGKLVAEGNRFTVIVRGAFLGSITSVPLPIKMCAHGVRSFVFYAPQARFICG